MSLTTSPNRFHPYSRSHSFLPHNNSTPIVPSPLNPRHINLCQPSSSALPLGLPSPVPAVAKRAHSSSLATISRPRLSRTASSRLTMTKSTVPALDVFRTTDHEPAVEWDGDIFLLSPEMNIEFIWDLPAEYTKTSWKDWEAPRYDEADLITPVDAIAIPHPDFSDLANSQDFCPMQAPSLLPGLQTSPPPERDSDTGEIDNRSPGHSLRGNSNEPSQECPAIPVELVIQPTTIEASVSVESNSTAPHSTGGEQSPSTCESGTQCEKRTTKPETLPVKAIALPHTSPQSTVAHQGSEQAKGLLVKVDPMSRLLTPLGSPQKETAIAPDTPGTMASPTPRPVPKTKARLHSGLTDDERRALVMDLYNGPIPLQQTEEEQLALDSQKAPTSLLDGVRVPLVPATPATHALTPVPSPTIIIQLDPKLQGSSRVSLTETERSTDESEQSAPSMTSDEESDASNINTSEKSSTALSDIRTSLTSESTDGQMGTSDNEEQHSEVQVDRPLFKTPSKSRAISANEDRLATPKLVHAAIRAMSELPTPSPLAHKMRPAIPPVPAHGPRPLSSVTRSGGPQAPPTVPHHSSELPASDPSPSQMYTKYRSKPRTPAKHPRTRLSSIRDQQVLVNDHVGLDALADAASALTVPDIPLVVAEDKTDAMLTGVVGANTMDMDDKAEVLWQIGRAEDAERSSSNAKPGIMDPPSSPLQAHSVAFSPSERFWKQKTMANLPLQPVRSREHITTTPHPLDQDLGFEEHINVESQQLFEQSASAKPQQGASLTRGKQRMKLQHIIDGLPPAVQLAPLSPVRPLMRSDSEMIKNLPDSSLNRRHTSRARISLTPSGTKQWRSQASDLGMDTRTSHREEGSEIDDASLMTITPTKIGSRSSETIDPNAASSLSTLTFSRNTSALSESTIASTVSLSVTIQPDSVGKLVETEPEGIPLPSAPKSLPKVPNARTIMEVELTASKKGSSAKTAKRPRVRIDESDAEEPVLKAPKPNPKKAKGTRASTTLPLRQKAVRHNVADDAGDISVEEPSVEAQVKAELSDNANGSSIHRHETPDPIESINPGIPQSLGTRSWAKKEGNSSSSRSSNKSNGGGHDHGLVKSQTRSQSAMTHPLPRSRVNGVSAKGDAADESSEWKKVSRNLYFYTEKEEEIILQLSAGKPNNRALQDEIVEAIEKAGLMRRTPGAIKAKLNEMKKQHGTTVSGAGKKK